MELPKNEQSTPWNLERTDDERASVVSRLAERANLLSDPEFSSFFDDVDYSQV